MQTAGPSKAVICHLDGRNCAVTRACSDVRETTERKPELGGCLPSLLLNISRRVGTLEINVNRWVPALIPVGPPGFSFTPNLKWFCSSVTSVLSLSLRHRETHLVWLEVLTLTRVYSLFKKHTTYSINTWASGRGLFCGWQQLTRQFL